jgi:glycosyltransferase involved in cell wall biosynthesis
MAKINITIPVYNEEQILEKNILRLFDFCQKNIADEWQIIIADNASVDRTAIIAQETSRAYPQIVYFHLPQKGKGLAIKGAWQAFPANWYIFMDADLSTDLGALPTLINELKNNQFDLVLGSRYLSGSKLKRTWARIIISKIYNLLIKIMFNCPVKDMANGFKGANQKIIADILPLIKNNEWFFDSELILLTHLKGYKIKEIPVVWQESSRPTRVNFWQTSWEYLKELLFLKLRKH